MLWTIVAVRVACCLFLHANGKPSPGKGPAPVSVGAALEGEMDKVIEDSKVDILSTNHIWTCGPLWSKRGSFLLFSDVHTNVLYKWKPDAGVEIFAENAGTFGPPPQFQTLEDLLGRSVLHTGSSGIAWDSEDEEGLYINQYGYRRVLHVKLWSNRSGLDVSTARIAADAFQGHGLSSPKDITTFQGNVYFSDPPFGHQLVEDVETHTECPLCACYARVHQSAFGVYMIRTATDGTLVRVATMPGPSGLAVHASTRRMLIANVANASAGAELFWVLYDVLPDGKLSHPPRKMLRYDDVWQGKYYNLAPYDAFGGVQDTARGFLITGPGGIYMVSPDGEVMGRLQSQTTVSNMALSSGHLFIAAEKHILRAKLKNITEEQRLQTDPQVVMYDFTVNYFKINPDGRGFAYVQGINSDFPAPTIHVNQGQRLIVRISNRMETEAMTLHFHGFEFRHTAEQPTRPGYDGAAGISSCDIPAGDTFNFDFVVDEHPGTYFYHDHGHAEHVGVRGLIGAVIVHPRTHNLDPHAGLYDGPASEHVLMLHDFWSKPTHELHIRQHGGFSRTPTRSAQGNFVGIIPFESMLVNGCGWYQPLSSQKRDRCERICQKQAEFNNSERLELCVKRCGHGNDFFKNLHNVHVNSGARIRLRLVNAGALYSVRFSVDQHSLMIIASDGADVVPMQVDELVLSAGERFDVILHADQPVQSYWVRVKTLEAFPHEGFAILKYQGSSNTTPPHTRPLPDPLILNCVDIGRLGSKCLPVTALQRHPNQHSLYAPHEHRPAPHSFEVSWRGMAGLSPGHFVRV